MILEKDAKHSLDESATVLGYDLDEWVYVVILGGRQCVGLR
jgi:hypothetical protein